MFGFLVGIYHISLMGVRNVGDEIDNGKKKSNPNSVARRFVVSATKSLDNIDVGSLEEEERDKIMEELSDLGKKIDNTLEKLTR